MRASADVCARCPASPAQGRISFFEAQSLAAQEPPDRIVRDDDPTRRQLRLQAMQRQVRILPRPLSDEGAVRFQNALAMAAHLPRRHRARCPLPLRPLHHRRDGNTEPSRHGTARLTAENRCHNAPAKIIRKRSDHRCWPPPSQHLESQSPQPGITLDPEKLGNALGNHVIPSSWPMANCGRERSKPRRICRSRSLLRVRRAPGSPALPAPRPVEGVLADAVELSHFAHPARMHRLRRGSASPCRPSRPTPFRPACPRRCGSPASTIPAR